MPTLLICLAVLMIALALLMKKTPSPRKEVHLLLTEKFYAVPGIECSIYFNNIVTVINYKNYAFEVICDLGRTDADRWRAVPEEKDIGEHKLTLRVHDENGIVAEGTTTVCVAAPIQKNQDLTLLLMGDSQTGACGYTERVLELMKAEEHVHFRMLGTNAGNYTEPVPGGVAHEGYGGWGWNTFFTNWGIDESSDNDGLHPRRPWVRNSRFLFPDGDAYKFDLVQYFDKYCEGRIPDTLIVMLGINNVFCAKSNAELDKIWATEIYPYMKKLVEEFRKLSPAPHIAFCTLTPGAFSQDAFGKSYQCSYTLWQWRKNHRYYHSRLLNAVKELQVDLIPVHAVVDGSSGFPAEEEPVMQGSEKKVLRASNGVHPNPDGYRQMGNCVFAYLKNLLNTRKS